MYADDLASGSVNEYKLIQVMRIVYRHGCTWQYEFNARMSGVLIYSQDQTHNRRHAPLREFRLGESIVSERMNYDHVGIQTSVNINDISRIEVRIVHSQPSYNYDFFVNPCFSSFLFLIIFIMLYSMFI